MSPVYAFSKSVRGDKIVYHKIADSKDTEKIAEVVQKLEALPKVLKSRLHELDLRTNPKNWLSSLLKGYPNEVKREEMEYLLLDFTEPMKTRMREESKYAIGLLMPNRLILCHSLFGEETITPEWKTIPRMLDSDNVLRFVCFLGEGGEITVMFWEREASSSFIEWLGLPRKQAFLFGGKYRIHCEIEGVITEFQLTEEEIEDWISRHPEFKEGKIRLSTPVDLLTVSEIRVGRRRYENARDFMQDYEAQSYGIAHYQEQYNGINKAVLPLLMKYYDEKTRVVRIEGDQEMQEVAKVTPNFDILFVNETIELRASYLTDIARRFVNSEPVKIFHAGHAFRTPPLVVASMEIYNEIQIDSLTRLLIGYYKETNLQDRILDRLLKYTMLQKLAESNRGLPIASFFGPLSRETMEEIILEGTYSKLEEGILEYKSQDIFAGGDTEIIRKLSEDLARKLKRSPFKVYIIGIEDDGTVKPLSASRVTSDRVEGIRTGVQNELSSANIYALPIIREDKAILLMLAVSS